MIIYGAGGHGKVVCDIVLDNNIKEQVIFVDDADKGSSFYYHPVFLLKEYPIKNQKMIIAIGNNLIRKKISSSFHNFGKAIHSSAILSPTVQVGDGTVIMANVCCNADATIGKHVILNTSCSVGHDCIINDFVHIAPNTSLAGHVEVGEGSHVGVGSSVIQGIKIGKHATIGAGTVVIRDVPDGATVVGVPGKIIKFNK